jgi:hypothetical protein
METIVPVIPSNLTAGDKTASRKYCSYSLFISYNLLARINTSMDFVDFA